MSPLLACLHRLHTTPMGAERVRKNLGLETEDVVEWCRERITDGDAVIRRQGKNWYITAGDCCITVNTGSCTIITAHKSREEKP